MKSNRTYAKALLATALLGAAGVSQAAFITSDLVSPSASSPTIVQSNQFKDKFAGLGITNYTLGASLATDLAGTVTYYYYGKEAGYRNDFLAGSLSHSSGATPTVQDYFANPYKIGTVNVAAGLLNFSFCAYDGSTKVGCVSNAQNDGLGMNSFQSIAMNVSGNTAWLFWDDSGAGPDDNHDDMLIKAVFTPTAVPEPATLAMFGLGLFGLSLGAKRRARKALHA